MVRNLTIRTAFLFAGLVLLSAAALARPALSANQEEVLLEVDGYFNAIRTMHGEFLQIGPNGEKSQGHFFIEKPGRIRFHYSKPVYLDIIADGKSVAVRDRKMATQDIYPLSKTPLKVLLANQINLTTDERVTSVTYDPDLITVEVAEESLFGKGKIVLFFDARKLELKQWTVTDAQGFDTSVTIFNVQTGHPQNPDLFKINYIPIR